MTAPSSHPSGNPASVNPNMYSGPAVGGGRGSNPYPGANSPAFLTPGTGVNRYAPPPPQQMSITLCPYCSTQLRFPVGAALLHCPNCNAISQLQTLPTKQLSCRRCRTILAYTTNYALIQCPKCTLIIDTRDPEGKTLPAGGGGGGASTTAGAGTVAGQPASNGAAAAAAAPTPKPIASASGSASSAAATPPGLDIKTPSTFAVNSAAAAAGASGAAPSSAEENRLAKILDEHRAKRASESRQSTDTELQPMKVVNSASAAAPADSKPKNKPESGWTNLLSDEPKYGQLTDQDD